MTRPSAMATADFSLFDVLVWARTKPADETYDFTNSRQCALAQFGAATGRQHLIGKDGTELLRLWPALKEAVNPGTWGKYPTEFTLGALVKRLEALCPPSEWTKADAYIERVMA